jgi:DNA-binding NarL/FixJ family response regulator
MRKTVLAAIANDQASIREAIRNDLLSEWPSLHFVKAVDELEAIKKAKKLDPQLILIGYSVAIRKATDIFEALRELLPAVPIFVLTDDYSLATEREALASGVTAVFSVDQDFESLRLNIRAALNGE